MWPVGLTGLSKVETIFCPSTSGAQLARFSAIVLPALAGRPGSGGIVVAESGSLLTAISIVAATMPPGGAAKDPESQLGEPQPREAGWQAVALPSRHASHVPRCP